MADQGSQKVDQVTLGDKNVETSQFDRYKGHKGVTDRITILSSKLIRGYNYYIEGKKTTFRAPENPEVLALCKKHLGEPTQKFALTLFKYLTDQDGALLDDTKCQGKVMLWSISESRYEELSAISKSWPLMDNGFNEPQSDLMVKCTEEQFQRMSFTPTPTAHWKSKQSWYDALKAKEAKSHERLRMTLGRQLTDLQIMELLGTSVPSQTGGTDRAGDVDLSDVLDD